MRSLAYTKSERNPKNVSTWLTQYWRISLYWNASRFRLARESEGRVPQISDPAKAFSFYKRDRRSGHCVGCLFAADPCVYRCQTSGWSSLTVSEFMSYIMLAS